MANNRKKKKKNGGVMQWVILAIILAVLFYSGFNFLKEFMTYREAENEYAEVNSLIEVAGEDGLEWLEMETSQVATQLYNSEEVSPSSSLENAAAYGSGAETPTSTAPQGNLTADGSVSQTQGNDPLGAGYAGSSGAGASSGSRLVSSTNSLSENIGELFSSITDFFARLFGLWKHPTQVAAEPPQENLSGLQNGQNIVAAPDEPAGEVESQEDIQTNETAEKEEKVFITYPRVNINYDELMAINSDFVGVLYMPALQLKYPVAHSHDNAEYLKRTFEGTSNPAGCIFMDVAASPDYSDRNTFIFGHNMKNLSMFGCLKTFQSDETLCPKHPYFYIYTKNKVYKYAIFAYYTVPTKDDMYLDFRGDDGYDAYVKKAVERSLFTPEEGAVDFSKRPNLVTLSTCYGSGHVYNFVVQGALQGVVERNAYSPFTAQK